MNTDKIVAANHVGDRERVLWVNVILQAIRDATEAKNCNAPDIERAQARAWFRPTNPDFIEACHCAHLDPDATYQKAMKAIATYDATIASGERYTVRDPIPADAPPRRTAKTYTHEGQTHTLAEWSAILGIKYETLCRRLRSGYSIADAFSPIIKRHPRPVTSIPANRSAPAKRYALNGVTKTLSGWAIHAGIDVKLLTYRMSKGMALELALTLKPRARAKAHTVGDVSKTLDEWAEHLGITYSALLARMRNGRSLAEAVAMTAGRWVDRGVVSDLEGSSGTGAGSAARETPNLEISQ